MTTQNTSTKEYTDIPCGSPRIAEALNAYLIQTIAQEEEPPQIIARVEKATLRITYDGQAAANRREWDMQLMGYRDGLQVHLGALSALDALLCIECGYRIGFTGNHGSLGAGHPNHPYKDWRGCANCSYAREVLAETQVTE